VDRVLVTMGGADPDNLTLRVLMALRDSVAGSAQIRVIIGGSYRHAEALEPVCQQLSAQLLCDVREMREQMAWADLAIAAGGSTNWEMAYLGLPAVVVAIAENQRGIAEGLAASGIVVSLGIASAVTEDRLRDAVNQLAQNADLRRSMSERGQKLVDGQGAFRVLAELGLS
jgi:spore coat polysaccharide biosynthesis predicted glycosyltransferase SpsG